MAMNNVSDTDSNTVESVNSGKKLTGYVAFQKSNGLMIRNMVVDRGNSENTLGIAQRVMGESWKALSDDEKKEWKRVADEYEPILTCVTCQRSFLKEKHYKYHIRNSGEFECSHCKKRFANNQNLKRHSLIHSTTEYNCASCGKNFSSKQALKRHTEAHNIDGHVSCVTCQKVFSYNGNLLKHVKRFHT